MYVCICVCIHTHLCIYRRLILALVPQALLPSFMSQGHALNPKLTHTFGWLVSEPQYWNYKHVAQYLPFLNLGSEDQIQVLVPGRQALSCLSCLSSSIPDVFSLALMFLPFSVSSVSLPDPSSSEILQLPWCSRVPWCSSNSRCQPQPQRPASAKSHKEYSAPFTHTLLPLFLCIYVHSGICPWVHFVCKYIRLCVHTGWGKRTVLGIIFISPIPFLQDRVSHWPILTKNARLVG